MCIFPTVNNRNSIIKRMCQVTTESQFSMQIVEFIIVNLLSYLNTPGLHTYVYQHNNEIFGIAPEACPAKRETGCHILGVLDRSRTSDSID